MLAETLNKWKLLVNRNSFVGKAEVMKVLGRKQAKLTVIIRKSFEGKV